MAGRKSKRGFYNYLVTLPDRWFPFSDPIDGKRVRGVRAYNYELQRAFERYGKNHFSYKLIVYRDLFHLVGSLLFILFAAIVSTAVFGSDTALYVLLAAALIAISAQEFYFHPRAYGQLLFKGVTDWLAWTIPIGIFLFTQLN